ncbi:unnamed protein product, partial [Didymodactylos carnosus]
MEAGNARPVMKSWNKHVLMWTCDYCT